jgi:hypothetical protein
MFCVRVGTLPYYRLYYFNTENPISKIAVIASQEPRSFRLLYAVTLWRARKLTELQFISIAVRCGSILSSRGTDKFPAVYCSSGCSHRLILLDHHRRSLLDHTWSVARQSCTLCLGDLDSCSTSRSAQLSWTLAILETDPTSRRASRSLPSRAFVVQWL